MEMNTAFKMRIDEGRRDGHREEYYSTEKEESERVH